MKKQYIIPQTTIATIATTTILAASDLLATPPADRRPVSDVSGSTTSPSVSDNQFSKQGFDLWADE